MNTNLRRRAVTTIASLALLAAGSGAAFARTLPGLAGQPYLPADYQCFNNGAGAEWNSCAATKTYCMALPVEGGSHHVLVTQFSQTPSQQLTCAATSVDRTATIFWGSPLVGASLFNVNSVIDLGVAPVPNFGALFVCCNMPNTAKLETVDF